MERLLKKEIVQLEKVDENMYKTSTICCGLTNEGNKFRSYD